MLIFLLFRILKLISEIKYVRSVMTDKNDFRMDIKPKIDAGNRYYEYYALSKYISSTSLSGKLKLKVFTTIIRPVEWNRLLGSNKDKDLLNVWEGKILIKVFDQEGFTDQYVLNVNGGYVQTTNCSGYTAEQIWS